MCNMDAFQLTFENNVYMSLSLLLPSMTQTQAMLQIGRHKSEAHHFNG